MEMSQERLDWIAEESEGRRYLVCQGYWSGFGGSWDWDEGPHGECGIWTDSIHEARFERNRLNVNADVENRERAWIILDTHLSDWMIKREAETL